MALLALTAYPQRPPDIKLDAASNREVVEGVVRAINKYYVSAEVAKQLETGLRDRIKNGDYDKITSAFDLVDALDGHMLAIGKDAHLKLAYSHRPGPPVTSEPAIGPDTPNKLDEEQKAARENNFGFAKVEILPGNIGYLAMSSFERPVFSGEMTGTAMSFLSNTDALIVGEPTRGGTHPGSFVTVHTNFAVFVPLSWFVYPAGTPVYPIGRPVFPDAKTDFRGEGIKPDVAVPAAQALKTAQISALEERIKRNAALKEDLQPVIDALRKELETLNVKP
jgi:hypothetical protein